MSEKIIREFHEGLSNSLNHLKDEFQSLRAGKAHPSIVEGIRVEAYGSKVPLIQVAGITTPEPDLILIQSWDEAMVSEIEKAILAGGLGLTPSRDGNLIRLRLPALSQERRAELIRVAKNKGEETQIAIRNLRHTTIEELKKLNLSEDEDKRLRKLIDEDVKKFSDEIDHLVREKETELSSI